MKIAVIIKHPYRDNDYRVDIIDAPEDTTDVQIEREINRTMLGPFRIVAISRRVDLNRHINLSTEQTTQP